MRLNYQFILVLETIDLVDTRVFLLLHFNNSSMNINILFQNASGFKEIDMWCTSAIK